METELLDALAGARRHWFAPGVGACPTPEDLESVKQIREQARTDDDMPRGEAVQVAWLVECYMGWPSFEGVVLDSDGTPLCLHAWNVTPDGGVIDAAADLHGSEDHVCIHPDHPAMQTYRREWTHVYNPSLSTRFPELRGCQWDGQTDMDRLLQARAASRSMG